MSLGVKGLKSHNTALYLIPQPVISRQVGFRAMPVRISGVLLYYLLTKFRSVAEGGGGFQGAAKLAINPYFEVQQSSALNKF